MKLSKADKKALLEWGYSEKDFPQIEKAPSKTVYTLADGTRISQRKAIELLGRKEYLSGIARSAFHMSAVRESKNEGDIFFDTSALFRIG